MGWLVTHWWTLTGLTVAAFLFSVSIAGLVSAADQDTERWSYKLGGDAHPDGWDDGSVVADTPWGDEAA